MEAWLSRTTSHPHSHALNAGSGCARRTGPHVPCTPFKVRLDLCYAVTCVHVVRACLHVCVCRSPNLWPQRMSLRPHTHAQALHHSHSHGGHPMTGALPWQPELRSSFSASDASALLSEHSRHACRLRGPASAQGGSSSAPSCASSRGASRPDVCVRASASAGDGSGDAGLQGSQQENLGDKMQSFVQAFWKFVRPHTIRGTVSGGSERSFHACVHTEPDM